MNEKHDNSGILFENDKTGGNPNWPDRKGSATIGGVDYWLSGWIKQGAKGRFLSLAFKRKDETAKPAPKPAPAQTGVAQGAFGDDDQVPF